MSAMSEERATPAEPDPTASEPRRRLTLFDSTCIIVGIVIGAAFGKIVNSLVSDVIMPPVGLLTQGVDFADLSFQLQKEVTTTNGDVITPAIHLQSGLFVNTIVNFLIVAWAMFVVVKLMNKRRKSILMQNQNKKNQKKR